MHALAEKVSQFSGYEWFVSKSRFSSAAWCETVSTFQFKKKKHIPIADICGLVGNGKPDALNSTSPLISDGIKAEYGDDSWHAAIYRRLVENESPILICGASLISRSVLVSGKHEYLSLVHTFYWIGTVLLWCQLVSCFLSRSGSLLLWRRTEESDE